MRAALAETHTAVVVLAGERAYKVKKPVRFPFVDLTTPELRRRACAREVELNRRIAPDVYLGVATLTGTQGEADEPVVVMRRLPDDRRLSLIVAARRDDARGEAVNVAHPERVCRPAGDDERDVAGERGRRDADLDGLDVETRRQAVGDRLRDRTGVANIDSYTTSALMRRASGRRDSAGRVARLVRTGRSTPPAIGVRRNRWLVPAPPGRRSLSARGVRGRL